MSMFLGLRFLVESPWQTHLCLDQWSLGWQICIFYNISSLSSLHNKTSLQSFCRFAMHCCPFSVSNSCSIPTLTIPWAAQGSIKLFVQIPRDLERQTCHVAATETAQLQKFCNCTIQKCPVGLNALSHEKIQCQCSRRQQECIAWRRLSVQSCG